jgi:hypothetical protein
MPIQTSISFQHDVAIKGQLWGNTWTHRISGWATTTIPFGVGLVVVTGANSTSAPLTGSKQRVAIPSATGGTFAGVSILEHKEPTGEEAYMTTLVDPQTSQFRANEPLPILRRGYIYVYAEVAVNPTLPVFLRHTTNAALVPGDFRTDADTSRADQISGARWAVTTTAAGLAVLELNLP